MRENKKIIGVIVVAILVLIGLVLTIILTGDGGSNIEPPTTPTVTVEPTEPEKPTTTPTPTTKPGFAWQDKPTVSPEQPTINITETPKQDDVIKPTPTEVPGWHVITEEEKNPKPEANIDTANTGINYNDYITVDEDGTIHMDTERYLEDLRKKKLEQYQMH